VVCRNPLIAEQRARKRCELLAGTEKDLTEIKRRVDADTLHGKAEIGLAVGAVVSHYKVKSTSRRPSQMTPSPTSTSTSRSPWRQSLTGST